MAWQTDGSAHLLHALRSSVRGIWIAAAFVMGLVGLYLTARISWHFVQLLERTVFAQPW